MTLEIETKERLRERIMNAALLEMPRDQIPLISGFLNHSSRQQRRDAAAVMLLED